MMGNLFRNEPFFSETSQLSSIHILSLFIFGGLLLLASLVDGGTTHLGHLIIRCGTLLLLGLFVWRATSLRRWPLVSGSLGWPVFGFVLLCWVSLLNSSYIHQSYQWMIVVLTYALFLYLLVCFLESWEYISKLLLLLTGVGVGESVVALGQALWHEAIRPTGTFFNPNFLAGYLSAIWCIALGSVCFRSDWRRSHSGAPIPKSCEKHGHPIRLIASLVILSLVLGGLIVTGSRAGFLTFMVGTAVILVARFGRIGLAVVIGVLVIGLAVTNPLRDRLMLQHTDNPISYARFHMWNGAVHMMRDYPFGVGLGLYQYVSPRYAFPVEGHVSRYGYIAKTPHNEFLQIGAELGFLGLGCLLWGMVSVGREVWKGRRLRLRRDQRGYFWGVVGALVTVVLHAALDSNFHSPPIVLLALCCVAMVVSFPKLAQGGEPPGWPLRLSSPGFFRAAVVIGLCLLALEVGRLGMAWHFHERGAKAVVAQEFPKARNLYARAILLDPGTSQYHRSQAALHFKMYQRDKNPEWVRVALDELTVARQLNPLDGRLQGLLGYLYIVLSPIPLDSPARLSHNQEAPETGSLRPGMKFLKAALAAYQAGSGLDPYNPFYLYERGRILYAMGQGNQAESVMQSVLSLEPNFLPARLWLAERYLTSARRGVAASQYQEILERQRRLTHVPATVRERQFLQVDLTDLAAEIEQRDDLNPLTS